MNCKILITLGALVVPWVAGSGCVAEEDTNEGTTCEQVAALMCERGCECQDGQSDGDPSACAWSYSEPGFSTEHGRSRNTCVRGLTTDACGDPTKTEDLFETCLEAMEAAPMTCAPPEDGAWSFVIPAECVEYFECNEGPCLD